MDKKITNTFWINALLFICFTILMVILYYKVISIICRYGSEPFYIKDYTKTKEFQEQIISEIQYIESTIDAGIELDSMVVDENKFSFLNRSENNVEYIANIIKRNGEELLLSNITDSQDELRSMMVDFENNDFYYICKLNEHPETSEEYLKYYQFHADQSKFGVLDIYIRINLEKLGYLRTLKTNYEQFSNNIIVWISLCFVLSLACIVMIVYLTKKVTNKYKGNWFDTLYFEEIMLYILLIIVLADGLVFSRSATVLLSNVYKWIIYLISYFILYNIYFTIIKRLKFGQMKNGFILPQISQNMGYIYKPIVVYIIICMSFAYLGRTSAYYIYDQDFFMMILIYTIVLLNVLKAKLELIEITKKIEEISKGNFNIRLESKNNVYKKLVDSINSIQIGIKEAVDEKLKSERLKTDLITNVSHDLKTPLTSIINYSKLLEKEDIQNENAQKYIKILEDKAQKLKNLTEDLIDISKITSGNESVNLQRLNFVEMVLQANGEFAEKFQEKGLDLISNISSDEMFVNIDSNKMWRVLENIYSNIYKYALESTRVYVELTKTHDTIKFSIKNISKEQLNINPDELMERFVRGDKSRTSGGNGLRSFNC